MKAYQIVDQSTFSIPKNEQIEKSMIEYETQINKLLKKQNINLIFDVRREKLNGAFTDKVLLQLKMDILESEEE